VNFDLFVHVRNQTAPPQMLAVVVSVILKGVFKMSNMFFDGSLIGVFVQVPSGPEMVTHISADTIQFFLKTPEGLSVKVGGFL